MARDKAKDDKLFNCSQQSEHDYVAGLYLPEQRPYVRKFLQTACGSIVHNSTHTQVYALIEHHLGYTLVRE